MGKAIRKIPIVGNLLAGPEKINPEVANRNFFDISKEVKPAQDEYAKLLGRSKAASEAGGARADVIAQMGQAALGKGPSLAEAQLKSAQDRNLAQQLGAIQSARGGTSALGQRALLQSMAGSGRDLAQQSVISRLQERNDFLNQAGAADQGLRSDIAGKLGLDTANKQSMQQWEMARVGAANAAQQANAANKNALTGALIGGAATLAGGMMGGPAGAMAGSQLGKMAAPAAMPATAGQSMFGANYGPGLKKGGLVKKLAEKKKSKEPKGYAEGGRVGFLGSRGQKEITEDILDNRTKFQQQPKARTVDTPEQLAKLEQVRQFYMQKEADRVKAATNNAPVPQAPIATPMPVAPAPEEGYSKYAPMGLEEGGPVSGPGTETSDSIPAMLSDGEFVVKASEVKKPGILEHLKKINDGKVSKKQIAGLAQALSTKKAR